MGQPTVAWACCLLLAGAAGAAGRELDPAACAARFDVQRDKIIRTEESRDMGARYLAELDVGARHECLRLCCETDACDVFVYEEKSPGSCYLFNCGPPEDFRCKFTAHSNFSSGVLALSRRLAELQDQERLTHHEHALARLRVVTTSTASSTAASTSPPPPPRPPEPPHQPLTGRCSRYQFECRRGGECIAVYNACDGVPQCADGSDEAPELGCPARTEPPPAPAPATASAPAPLTAAPPRGQAAEGGQIPAAGGGQMSAAEGGQLPAAERWPHRLAQAQPQHRFNEAGGSSHIFSHKGGLLQEPEGAQFPPLEPPWPRRWPPPGAEGMGVERGWGASGGAARRPWAEPEPRPQWPEPEPRAQWPEPDPRPQWPETDPRPEWSEPDPRRAWPVPQPRSDLETTGYRPGKTMPEVPGLYSSQQHTLRDSPKKGPELSERPPAPPAPPTSPHTPPARTHVPQKVVVSEGGAAAGGAAAGGARALAAPEAADDGRSERPPAAVLLLVLGVGMAGSLGALAACRARARRRMRRGKAPFAHDADYLVNGMYL